MNTIRPSVIAIAASHPLRIDKATVESLVAFANAQGGLALHYSSL